MNLNSALRVIFKIIIFLGIHCLPAMESAQGQPPFLQGNTVIGQCPQVSDSFARCYNKLIQKSRAAFVRIKLSKMDLDEKIGKLFMVDVPVAGPGRDAQIKLIRQYKIGGAYLDGACTQEELRTIRQRLHAVKKDILIGQDVEWPTMCVTDAPALPRSMLTLGAIPESHEGLVFVAGKALGFFCRVSGVHLNAAPVVDVNTNPNNPVIGFRAFGDNPPLVARRAYLLMKGIQSRGVLACAKHFPGHGDTAIDSHTGLPRLTHSCKRLESTELYPFKEMIHQGVAAIMSAHITIPVLDSEQPATLSRLIMTDLLQQELGFKGLVITDALNMGAIGGQAHLIEIEEQLDPELKEHLIKANVQAFIAGNDVLIYPRAVPESIQRIKQLIADHPEYIHELNERVKKILFAQKWLESIKEMTPAYNEMSEIDREQIKGLSESLYQAAMTLVRNTAQALPLKKDVPPASLGIIQIGKAFPAFERSMRKYYQGISEYIIYEKEQLRDQPNIAEACHKYDMILVVIPTTLRGKFFNIHELPQETAAIAHDINVLLTNLNESHKKSAVVLFGNPYLLAQLPKDIPALVAYEDNEVVHACAARTLCGVVAAEGQLPITLPEAYEQKEQSVMFEG